MLAPVSGLTCSRKPATEQIQPSKKKGDKAGGEKNHFLGKNYN